jgi:uncharacterized protein YbcI
MAVTGSNANIAVGVSKAVVRLHKEQFGRGPTHARTDFAGPDTLVCVLEGALLPAERALVELGEEAHVRELRALLQAGTRHRFIAVVEDITGRKVRGFSSAIDPPAGIVFETYALEPADGAT